MCRASASPYGALDGSMPFELRALECALDSAVQLLSGEVAVLEREAYPVIDALAAQARRGLWELVLQHVLVFGRLDGHVRSHE